MILNQFPNSFFGSVIVFREAILDSLVILHLQRADDIGQILFYFVVNLYLTLPIIKNLATINSIKLIFCGQFYFLKRKQP